MDGAEISFRERRSFPRRIAGPAGRRLPLPDSSRRRHSGRPESASRTRGTESCFCRMAPFAQRQASQATRARTRQAEYARTSLNDFYALDRVILNHTVRDFHPDRDTSKYGVAAVEV